MHSWLMGFAEELNPSYFRQSVMIFAIVITLHLCGMRGGCAGARLRGLAYFPVPATSAPAMCVVAAAPTGILHRDDDTI